MEYTLNRLLDMAKASKAKEDALKVSALKMGKFRALATGGLARHHQKPRGGNQTQCEYFIHPI